MKFFIFAILLAASTHSYANDSRCDEINDAATQYAIAAVNLYSQMSGERNTKADDCLSLQKTESLQIASKGITKVRLEYDNKTCVVVLAQTGDKFHPAKLGCKRR